MTLRAGAFGGGTRVGAWLVEPGAWLATGLWLSLELADFVVAERESLPPEPPQPARATSAQTSAAASARGLLDRNIEP